MKCKFNVLAALASLLVLAAPGLALAACSLGGNIEAQLSNDPLLPMYTYTMTVQWDMDSPHGLSHLDLVVDISGGTCGCSDFSEAISVGATGGTSDGVDGCRVDYLTSLECSGDPSIPGVSGILYKFEPMAAEGCEPDFAGTGVFVFYSDLAPVPVDEEFVALVDKASLESCSGNVTGVFPGMACDPVPVQARNLDAIKSLYR